MSDILSACTNESRVLTKICLKANISFDVGKKYVTILNDSGILDKTFDNGREKPATIFSTNQDGRIFNIALGRILVKLQ